MARKTPKNRAEALALERKRLDNINNLSEARIQSIIVTDFANKLPEDRGALFLVDNNADNPASMSYKISQGLVAGVSDLILLKDGMCIGCEIKTLNKRHDAKHCLIQANWIINHCRRGGFVTSLSMFWDLYRGITDGIPAQFVKDYILRTEVKTVLFSNILKLWYNERK